MIPQKFSIMRKYYVIRYKYIRWLEARLYNKEHVYCPICEHKLFSTFTVTSGIHRDIFLKSLFIIICKLIYIDIQRSFSDIQNKATVL